MREMRRERDRRELGRIAAFAVGAGDDDAPTELARRRETRRGRGSKTTPAETSDVGLAEGAQATECAKHLVREHERGAPRRTAPDQERDELVVRKRLGA